MRNLLAMLLFCGVTLVTAPGIAESPVPVRTFTSEGVRFEVSGDRLVLFVDSEDPSAVAATTVLERDGQLKVSGVGVETDRRDRKLLKRLFAEVAEMSVMIEAIAEDVSTQLRPDLGDREREKLARRLQRTGERMEAQQAEVAALAQELLARIPELGVLQRFAED